MPTPQPATADLASTLTLLATGLHHSGAVLWQLLRQGATLEQARSAMGLTDRHVRRLFSELQEAGLAERGEVCDLLPADVERIFGKGVRRWGLGRYYHRALDLNAGDVERTRSALTSSARRQTDLEEFTEDSVIATLGVVVDVATMPNRQEAMRQAPMILARALPPIPDSLVSPAVKAALDAVDRMDMENMETNEPTAEDIITAGKYGVDWEE